MKKEKQLEISGQPVQSMQPEPSEQTEQLAKKEASLAERLARLGNKKTRLNCRNTAKVVFLIIGFLASLGQPVGADTTAPSALLPAA